jgi:hypothetical protein
MRLMRFVSIDGDIHHEQGFVQRDEFVGTYDFIGVADRDHVRRAANFNDPDVVPVPFRFHHVRKVTCWILGRGGRSRKATKDDYAACEAQCNGSSFLQVCHLRLPTGNDEIISQDAVLKITDCKARAALQRVEGHARHAFLPQVELQREAALAFVNQHFLR